MLSIDGLHGTSSIYILFFIIVLCCLRSSSYHGFGAMSSRALSTSFVKWFIASSGVVLLRISLSLNFSFNMLLIFFADFQALVVIFFGVLSCLLWFLVLVVYGLKCMVQVWFHPHCWILCYWWWLLHPRCVLCYGLEFWHVVLGWRHLLNHAVWMHFGW